MRFDYAIAVMPWTGHISDAIAHCLNMVASESGSGRVVLIFNDTPVDVRHGDTPDGVYQRWQRKRQ